MSDRTPIRLLRGSNVALLGDRVDAAVDEAVGEGDRSLVLDEFADEDYDLGAVADAACTPPLFGDRRVVVARGASRFSKADDVAPLVQYLEHPMESSIVIVVWEPVAGQSRLSAVPKSLAQAIEASGGVVVATDPGTGRSDRDDWWTRTFTDAAVRLDAASQKLIRDRVGEDLDGVPSLLRILVGSYGAGATLTAEKVEPFLGESGSVPPWELTDAIDRGDAPGALDALHRMSGAGDRHPLQIMATLSSTYLRIARLDGAGVGNERDAAALLGMKGSTFPAKKAMATARALGSTGARRAVELCAEADLALRGGGTAWPGELVLEVLVARLCRLSGRRHSRR